MNIPIKRYFALLITYLKPQWLKTALMVICLLAGTIFQLVTPQIIGSYINLLSSGGPIQALLAAGVLYMLSALLNQGITVGEAYFSAYVAWTATNQLRSDLLAHCLSLDMEFHKTHTSGEMIERIDGDVDALSNFFSNFTVNLISNLLLLLGILGLFFFMSWLVGLVMSLFALLALTVLSWQRRRAIPAWKDQRRMSALYYGFLGERFGGLEDIRANGAELAIMRGFYQRVREWLPLNNRANGISVKIGIGMLALYAGGTALALGLGLYLWDLKEISLGTIYILFAYTNTLAQPLNVIQDEMQDLQQAEACIERVETLLSRTSALPDTGTATLPEGPLSIAFRAVDFGYAAQEPVLHQLSFEVPPGSTMGILGRTGSGKTTLARLLFRLYDPQGGAILVQGRVLPEIGLHELRRHIGMVTQEVQIFHASVRDNLTFFAHDIPDARIIALLEELGLGIWYRGLAEGLDTPLGSGQGERGLSAGEAQLLACARVFLANPGILILDEASSRLDPATEKLMEQAIARLLKNRTALIIAHRLSTLHQVDTLLLLQQGAVLEHGSRSLLTDDPDSHFARLLRSESEEVLR